MTADRNDPREALQTIAEICQNALAAPPPAEPNAAQDQRSAADAATRKGAVKGGPEPVDAGSRSGTSATAAPSDDLCARLRAAGYDERLSTGALHFEAAERLAVLSVAEPARRYCDHWKDFCQTPIACGGEIGCLGEIYQPAAMPATNRSVGPSQEGTAGSAADPAPPSDDDAALIVALPAVAIILRGRDFQNCAEIVDRAAARLQSLAAERFSIGEANDMLLSRVEAAEARCAELEAERDEARGLHQQLMFQVARKYPGETRHETALRYLREREQEPHGTGAARNAPGREGG